MVGNDLWFCAHGFYEFFNLVRKDLIPVKDEILGNRIKGECLSQLLFDPSCCRVLRHIDMYNFPSGMVDNKENEKDAEVHGWHDKEVHC